MATTNLGRIGLVSRGTWSAGTYKNLDVVSYNNSLYICKVTTTTDAPTVTASWDLYVSDSGAAASATAAASSATAAAASYDSFDDRYLGAKTSDPTVDNDGNALLTGALYWNSATGVFKVWSGSAWVTNITSNQFGTNVATFLQTPTSANLAAALTDETGSGAAVFASNPTFPAQINLTANSGYNIYASGTADNYLAGGLTVGAVISTGIGVTTGETAIELGSNRTGDGVSYIDFHSTSGTDYETRIIRAAGTNGALQIINTGTGELQLQSANTASITFLTSATERMRIDSAGRIGINITPSAGRGLTIAGSGLITGAVNGFSVLSAPVVAADVTGDYNIFRGTTTTAASAFTLANAINFVAAQGVIGAGSSITSQYGFQANETLIGATSNNWGFVGNIPAGTGRYNLYMAGTADNYLAGSLGIGGVPAAGTNLILNKNLTGAAYVFGVDNQYTIQSDVTGETSGFRSVAYTQAASFTLPSIKHYNTVQVAFGAGSSVTNQYGFNADGSLTGATNNYGFYGGIAAAAGTVRYNLYMAGTADNYLAGSLGIGTASPDASAILDVQSTTKGVRMPNMTTTQKNAIASPAAGLMVFDTNLAKLCVYTGAAWQTITSI